MPPASSGLEVNLRGVREACQELLEKDDLLYVTVLDDVAEDKKSEKEVGRDVFIRIGGAEVRWRRDSGAVDEGSKAEAREGYRFRQQIKRWRKDAKPDMLFWPRSRKLPRKTCGQILPSQLAGPLV